MWGAHNLRRGRHKGLPDRASARRIPGLHLRGGGQTAKERNTKLEVAKHPALYYQVDRRLNTRLVYSDGPHGKKP